MTAPDLAVMEANYADFKLVRTRSAAQLILEIPIEEAQRAIELFGIPQPGQETRVAIARLEQNVVRDTAAATPPAFATATDDSQESADRAVTRSERSRSAYQAQSENEKVVTRSAMLCADPEFWRWALCSDEEEAAKYIRAYCGVKSRRDLASDADARRKFLYLEFNFNNSAGRTAEPR